jgi:glycosyltransferase involved in cell wall biosynthesis
MLNKIYKKFFSGNNKALLNEKIKELTELRDASDEIAIYGSPTEGNWLGIANATKSLFPTSSYEYPQWYSKSVFSKSEWNVWKKELIKLNFKKITISGFATFFCELIEEHGENNFFEVIYHGTWSELHNKEIQYLMNNIFKLTQKGNIKRIGFVKKGMAETVSKLLGYTCFHTPLPTPIIPKEIKKLELDRSKIHIGVFGADTFNKNLHNQVVHALLIENSIIHVLDKSIFSYLNMEHRIVEHGKNLPKEKFLSILGSMDLNLYMSYSESWGLVAFESEAMGVPCIQSLHVDYEASIIEKIQNIKS